MTEVLQEIESVIRSPAVQWRAEPFEQGATLYAGNRDGWQVQVVALGGICLGTAVHKTPNLLVVKLTDDLSTLALSAAQKYVARSAGVRNGVA